MNVQRHTHHGTRSLSGRPHHLAVPMGLRTLLAVLTLVISFSTLAAPAGAHEYVPDPPLAADDPHSHTVPVCPAGFTASVEPGTGELACLGPYLNGYTNLCMNGVLIDEATCQYQTGTTTTTGDVWVVDTPAYSYEEDQGYYVTDIVTECETSAGTDCGAGAVADQWNGQNMCFEISCFLIFGADFMCSLGPPPDVTTCTDTPVQTWVPNMVTVYVDEVGHWETQTVTVPVYATEPSYLGCLPGWNDNGDGCTNPLGTNVPPSSWACPAGWATEGPVAPELITAETLCWFSADANELFLELIDGSLPDAYTQTLSTELFDVPAEYATDGLYELSASRFITLVSVCRDGIEGSSDDSRSWGQRWFNVVTNPISAGTEIISTVASVNPVGFVTDYVTCFAKVLIVPQQDSLSIILTGRLQSSGFFPSSFSECEFAPGPEQNSCVTRGFLSAPIHTLNKAAAGELDCKGPNLPIASMISTATSNLPDDNPLASQDLVGDLDDEDFYPASGCVDTHIASVGSYVRDPLSWLIAFWCIWTLMKVGRRAVVGG